jgi:type IV pilus assembly protein PilA
MLKTVQKGFTLIELMIVIAIIGILAAIAIPAYQNYTIRSQITEGLSLADGWKTAISEYYAQNGSFPSGAGTSGGTGNIAVTSLTTTGKYVGNIAVGTGGQIKVTYNGTQANAKINTSYLSLSPGVDANQDVIWICGTAATPTGVSVTAATGSSGTTVSAAFLPTACHS